MKESELPNYRHKKLSISSLYFSIKTENSDRGKSCFCFVMFFPERSNVYNQQDFDPRFWQLI